MQNGQPTTAQEQQTLTTPDATAFGAHLGSGSASESDSPNRVQTPSTPFDRLSLHSPHTRTFSAGGTTYCLPTRYELIKTIGQGAYGVVISCSDALTGEAVAVKKIQKAFDNMIDAKRVCREIRLLRHLEHENLMSITDIVQPASFDSFRDVYIVSPLMETDLHRIIYSRQDLTDDHVQYFVYQILRGLKYMHSANVIHRDLKPSNILLNSNCDLKICDFGLARGLEETGMLTEYVVTRWYRAPEIMLSYQEYSKAVDVWSVGCIFAELVGRRPLFAGDDYIHQLRIITDVLGSPTDEDMHFVNSVKALRFMKNMEKKQPKPFTTLYPRANPESLKLLTEMLLFDPAKRITATNALAHPYMDALHCEADEPICESTFSHKVQHKCRIDDLKLKVFEDVCAFHPEAKREYLQVQQRLMRPQSGGMAAPAFGHAPLTNSASSHLVDSSSKHSKSAGSLLPATVPGANAAGGAAVHRTQSAVSSSTTTTGTMPPIHNTGADSTTNLWQRATDDASTYDDQVASTMSP